MTRECHVRFFEKGVDTPTGLRATEPRPHSPSLCTLLLPGGWPPISDLPSFQGTPGSIWFSIKVIPFPFVYIWVRAAFP